jgi:hypothetical protein
MKSESDSSEEAKTNIHASINFIYLFTLCEPQSGLLLPGHGWVFFFFFQCKQKNNKITKIIDLVGAISNLNKKYTNNKKK